MCIYYCTHVYLIYIDSECYIFTHTYTYTDALVSLEQFWIEDIPFSVDLLKQFLEDMDAYTNVHT